jgi:hypothetical protein
MRKDIDYVHTFSATVTADSIRWFFSLATYFKMQVSSLDVKQAYLQGTQQIVIYAFLPSYIDLAEMTDEQLLPIRHALLEMLGRKGRRAIKQLARSKRRQSSRVLRILRSIYGDPSAGHVWSVLLIYKLTSKLGFTRSRVDGCVYFKTRGKRVKRERGGGESAWFTEYVVLVTWTDDLPYFGTSAMKKEFEMDIARELPVTFSPVCRDFVGIEVEQFVDRGVTFLTQKRYWELAAERFREYLKPSFCVRTPLPERLDLSEPTEEEKREAKDLPYRQLLGCMAFPSCHTKLEIRFAISILSRFMQGWGVRHWGYALHCLKYCIYARFFGLVYVSGVDWHGCNVPYAYGDSSFEHPKSQGCRMVMMNGALVSMSSQRHTTIDTSTTAAELTEAFLASNDIMGFRNLMTELGFELDGPTVLYQDNQPAIQVVEGERNLGSVTKHMSIRTWKLTERVEDRHVCLEYCGTTDMLADIGTKSLNATQFCYLRDWSTGYALLRIHHPDLDPMVRFEEAQRVWTLMFVMGNQEG